MSIDFLPSAAVDAAAFHAALPGLCRYSPWRQHRLLPAEQLLQIESVLLANARDDASAVLRLLVDRGVVLGYCAVTPLPWDSAHFGLPMGRLDCRAIAGCAPEHITRLVTTTIAAASTLALRHISTQVDLDDYGVFNALAAAGFRLYDIRRRYTIRRLPPARTQRSPFTLRDLRDDDRDPVLALVSGTPFRSRFTRDPHLDPARSASLYMRWAERILACRESDCERVVVERRGEHVAFGGLQVVDFSAQGVPVKILADAIFAGGRRAVGCFVPVVHRLAERGLARFPLVEARISANNTAAARVLEDGGYRSTTGDCALHLWLPPAAKVTPPAPTPAR